MQVVIKIFLILSTIGISIILFAPKQNLYFLVEKELKKNGNDIIINNEKINDYGLGLKILDGEIYIKGIKLIKFESINIMIFFLFNHISITNINIDKSLKNFIPHLIKSLDITHSIISPMTINFNSKGSFGDIEGFIDLKKQYIKINFIKIKDISSIKKLLSKNKKGWYYERKF